MGYLITFLIILIILLIFTLLLLTRNILLNKYKAKSKKLYIDLQRSLNASKTTIKKAESLQRTKKDTYASIYLELKKLSIDMENNFEIFLTSYLELDQKIQKREIFKVIRDKNFLWEQADKFQNLEIQFKNKSNNFKIPWSIIDEDFSNMLDISQNLLNWLDDKEYNLHFLNNNWKNKVTEFRKNLQLVEKAKLNAEFEVANKNIIASKEQVKELIIEINRLEKLEYVVFYQLPKTLLNRSQNINLPINLREYYEKFYKDFQKTLRENTSGIINNSQLILRARNIYKIIYEMDWMTNKQILFNNFYNVNRKLMDQIVQSTENKINNLKNPSFKLESALQIMKNSLKTLGSNSVIENKINDTKRFIYGSKKFDREYYYSISKHQIKNVQRDRKIHKIENSLTVYFAISISEMLDSNPETEQELIQLKNLYQNYFANELKFSEIDQIWSQWIKLLANLTRKIAINEKYLAMYKKLEEYLGQSYKYKNKLNDLKIILKAANNDLVTKNFKDAYFKLKSFINKN
ncbi:Uncharacterised protein (plasmid) [Mycoplasmopsis gallopavonis]|uniref:Uncharacterized protein n=1 Tax=Mycoplasmopsis gallopavonis TaxID=76629 RepID=A0A449B036_9BACT|nr:hypothetical protein [Mycoplasmopsis gallopavonis]VEU73121.1 Uncharacterised protein [Mycoplasmopsis gallopavonis]